MTNESLPDQDTAIRQQANGHAASSREGLVVALAPGLFEVVASDGVSWLCTLRGRLRKRRPTRPLNAPSPATSPAFPAPAATEATAEAPTRVAPGDRVRFTPLGNGEGVIEEVMPRRTVLARARPEVGTEQVLLANPDQAALVFAMREPSPHFGLLDRYLALCEHAHVPALICLNKDDLGEPEEVAAAERAYCALGDLPPQ